MTNYIRKMSGKQYLKRIQENPTVIIPTGACEIYGPQLPMGSDLIVAKRISELVAEKTGAMIAPTIECGESSALAAFSCTFPMPRKILEDYLDFLMGKLIKDGIKNFIFITGHAGNVDTANYIGKKYLAEHGDIKLVQIDWWRFANANSGDIFEFSGWPTAMPASAARPSCCTCIRSWLTWRSSRESSRQRPTVSAISSALQNSLTGRPTEPSEMRPWRRGKKAKRL